MISAEEVRKYQEEQKEKIDVTSYITAIEETIKENMTVLSFTGTIYEFNNVVCKEALMKIKKILEDKGYKVTFIPHSHYYEFGGIGIDWGE